MRHKMKYFSGKLKLENLSNELLLWKRSWSQSQLLCHFQTTHKLINFKSTSTHLCSLFICCFLSFELEPNSIIILLYECNNGRRSWIYQSPKKLFWNRNFILESDGTTLFRHASFLKSSRTQFQSLSCKDAHRKQKKKKDEKTHTN